MTRLVRVVVVDESAFNRRAWLRMLGSDARFKVVAQVAEAAEALRALDEPGADVMLLDLERRGRDGLELLGHVRARRADLPVIVLAGGGDGDSDESLRALELGAFEVVAKPAGGPLAIHDISAELVAKVSAAAGLGGGSGPLAPPRSAVSAILAGSPAEPGSGPLAVDVVILATSTGGPPVLKTILAALPAGFPVPVVVLQHMPPGYTRSLAARLDEQAGVAVRQAVDGDLLVPGQVLVAPSGEHLAFRQGVRGVHVIVTPHCPIPTYYRPCIDHTFMEAARVFGRRVLAVVLTGMGEDGARGVPAIRAAGGHVWAQDEASSAIFGMPRAAIESGLVEEVLPAGRIGLLLAGRIRPASPAR